MKGIPKLCDLTAGRRSFMAAGLIACVGSLMVSPSALAAGPKCRTSCGTATTAAPPAAPDKEWKDRGTKTKGSNGGHTGWLRGLPPGQARKQFPVVRPDKPTPPKKGKPGGGKPRGGAGGGTPPVDKPRDPKGRGDKPADPRPRNDADRPVQAPAASGVASTTETPKRPLPAAEPRERNLNVRASGLTRSMPTAHEVFDNVGTQALEAGRRFAFPLLLTLLVVMFLLLQNRFDRREEKLALAPVDFSDGLLNFE